MTGEGCADMSEEALPGGPIVADLYPALLAGCRRGCRPGRGTPPPPSTRSAWSRYSEPRNLRRREGKGNRPLTRGLPPNSPFTHRLLCCSSTRCSGRNRSLSHDASPRRRGRRGSACDAAGWRRWGWSRTDPWVRTPGSSRAPC